MSYIPKYILKRMLPERECKLLNNNELISITFINVISPITFPDINTLQSYLQRVNELEVSIGGSSLSSDVILRCKAKYEDNLINVDTIDQLANITLPVGGKFEFLVPVNGLGMSPGDMKVELKIKSLQIDIKVDRNFQDGGLLELNMPKGKKRKKRRSKKKLKNLQLLLHIHLQASPLQNHLHCPSHHQV